jgi:hypothetical protein
MKGMRVHFLVAVFVCAFASRANAQGTVTWACGYPQAGPMGTIVVKGTATPDCGWNLGGATVTYWPEGGGVAQTVTITVDTNGNWSGTFTVAPGITYNVVVEVGFGNMQMMTTAAVAPDPATVTVSSCPP